MFRRLSNISCEKLTRSWHGNFSLLSFLIEYNCLWDFFSVLDISKALFFVNAHFLKPKIILQLQLCSTDVDWHLKHQQGLHNIMEFEAWRGRKPVHSLSRFTGQQETHNCIKVPLKTSFEAHNYTPLWLRFYLTRLFYVKKGFKNHEKWQDPLITAPCTLFTNAICRERSEFLTLATAGGNMGEIQP